MRWLAKAPGGRVAHYLANGPNGTVCGARLPVEIHEAIRMDDAGIEHFAIDVCKKCRFKEMPMPTEETS